MLLNANLQGFHQDAKTKINIDHSIAYWSYLLQTGGMQVFLSNIDQKKKILKGRADELEKSYAAKHRLKNLKVKSENVR